MLLFTAYLSESIDSRVAATIILQIWVLPLLIALYTFSQQTSPWDYFAVVTLITGFPYVHPIQVAWASRNSYSVRTRYVYTVLIVLCLSICSTVSARSVSGEYFCKKVLIFPKHLQHVRTSWGRDICKPCDLRLIHSLSLCRLTCTKMTTK